MATQPRLMTAEELLRMPDDGMCHELVRGELRTMPPPGARHEEIAGRVLIRVGPFVEAHGLGRVYGAPGFRIERDPVRNMELFAQQVMPHLRPMGQPAGAKVLG